MPQSMGASNLIRLQNSDDGPSKIVWSFRAPIYCLDCGFLWPSKEYVPGDFLIMIVLCFFFLLPGLIYWGWRLNGRYWGCAKCRSKRIIPADAPAAQAALKKTEGTVLPESRTSAAAPIRFCTACGKPIYERNKFCGSCGESV
jgi:hypothetical protein